MRPPVQRRRGSSRWIFRHHASRQCFPWQGRKIQKLLELPPIPARRSVLRRMRSAAPANCVCQEKTAGCCVFREDSSSSFRRSRLAEACFAGCEVQHQQAVFAKKKQQDAVFFVKTAPRASPIPARRSVLRRMRSAAPASCVCQEKTAGCCVFREDSSSSFRRSRLAEALRRMRSAAPASCVCQEKTAGCCVFREDSSSSFRRSRLAEACFAGCEVQHQQLCLPRKNSRMLCFS
jgi:hypothetical protein